MLEPIKPRRFTVIVARFAFSGVPLAQMRLAHALSTRGYQVDLIVGYVPSEYEMPVIEGVNIIVFGTPKTRDSLIPLVRYFWSAKPDAVFTAEDHQNIFVLLAAIISRSKARISGSSRVTPFDTYSTKLFSKRWFLKHLMRATMWRANALTCVSQDMVDQYRIVFRKPPHVCIYNFVDYPEARARIKEPVDHPWFDDKSIPVCIAAGQLGPWKGFTYLIRAMYLLNQKRPVRLILLGDGSQKQELLALIQELDLADRIRLEGNVKNPLKYFTKSNVFVLSSLVEGLPNVLVEAMMCGCTPVATNCPTGPREVLQDGKYGYLVPVKDPEAMASAIDTALDNPIPKKFLLEAVQPFEESTIINKHFEVLGLCQKSST